MPNGFDSLLVWFTAVSKALLSQSKSCCLSPGSEEKWKEKTSRTSSSEEKEKNANPNENETHKKESLNSECVIREQEKFKFNGPGTCWKKGLNQVKEELKKHS